MKNFKFLIPALALVMIIGACQNRSSETAGNDSTMQDDESSMSMDGMNSMKSNEMMSAMSGMMDAMKQMTMTGNADVDFAMMMQRHYQGAVDMAAIELESGEDTTLKQLAQKIIENQKTEIKELQAFIDAHKNPAKNYDPTKKNEGFAKSMEESMMVMMNMPKMDDESASSTDHRFVDMMIPHHQSAVDMAKGFLQYGKDDNLKSMATKIVEDQNMEIAEFKKWKSQVK